MIDGWTLAAISLMAFTTYLTRIGGYLMLGGRTLSPRMMAMLDTAPGCVLMAVIAPSFFSGRVADPIALLLTTVIATRLPMLPTVVGAVASAALLRSVLG